MNVVDSSGWLEYFADAENADFFEAAIEDTEHLIVPAITLYEVFKRICQQQDEGAALQVVAQMQQGQVIPLTATLSLNAAQISLKERLPMADSIILATAQLSDAVVWTQDKDFEGIDGVHYIPKVYE